MKQRMLLAAAAVLWLPLAACMQPHSGAVTGSVQPIADGSATGIGGAVASSEANATVAGSGILERGGNAVDAAVAVGFALAVTYPAAGNLGGGGFMLYRTPSGISFFLDFREIAPTAARADMYLDANGIPDAAASTRGWRAAGVPGSVIGLYQAHQKWGRLPWTDLLKPAIHLAEQGFHITARQADSLNRQHLAFSQDPMAARVMIPSDQRSWSEGDRLVQVELGATLRAIAESGEDAMRKGPIVERTVAASIAGGGVLSAADFANYEPVVRPVHRIEWNGLALLTATPPSSGAVFLHQVLSTLEGQPLAEWGFRDARTIQLIGEATAAAFRDRNRYLGDPAGFDFQWELLLDPAYLAERRRSLRPEHYTPPAADLPAPPIESTETTHFSVVDANGGAVAVTTTLNGSYGAKVMAPDGFFLNNEMDDFAAQPGVANQFGLVQGRYNAIAAGRRPLSSMSPVLVLRDGAVDAVFGSPGGPTILTTVLQVLLNRYVFGLDPQAAVRAPRFHRQDLPPVLRFEAGRLDRHANQALDEWGQPLSRTPSIGDVNAIFRDLEAGEWRAVADPRRSGLGLVLPLRKN